MKATWTSRVPQAALILVLVLTQGPTLLAAGANNLATLALAPEWSEVAQEIAPPSCERRLAASAAEPYLSLALQWDPRHQGALMNQGRVAWLKGECARAWESWAQVVRATPVGTMAPFWLSWASGAPEQMLAAHLPAEAAAQYAYHAGRRAESVRKDTAATWYQLSLDVKANWEAADRLARLSMQAGHVEQAVAVWQRLAAELPRDSADHWRALGREAELLQEWEQAAWAYGHGAEVAEQPSRFWLWQGQAFERLERWEEAEGSYRRALAVDPGNVKVYWSMGDLRRKLGDYEGALGAYQAALERSGSHHRTYAGLAQTYHRLGELTRAVEALNRAIALHPGQPWQQMVQLGDWRLELGDREGALAAYRRALAWNPGEAAIEERIEQAAGQD